MAQALLHIFPLLGSCRTCGPAAQGCVGALFLVVGGAGVETRHLPLKGSASCGLSGTHFVAKVLYALRPACHYRLGESRV